MPYLDHNLWIKSCIFFLQSSWRHIPRMFTICTHIAGWPKVNRNCSFMPTLTHVNVRAEFGKEFSLRLKEPIKKEMHNIVWVYTDDSNHNGKRPRIWNFKICFLRGVFNQLLLLRILSDKVKILLLSILWGTWPHIITFNYYFSLFY